MRQWLVGVALVAAWSGTACADEADVVKKIEERGGVVRRDGSKPGTPVVAVSLANTEATDADLKGIQELKDLTALDLGFTKVTDAGLKEVKGCKQLTKLILARTKVTDAGLDDVGALVGLTSLSLFDTKVTPDGLKKLKGLTKLTELNLVPFQMSDASVKVLAEIGLLHATVFAEGEGGERPKDAASVRMLDLSYSQVTEACLKDLKSLTALRTLNLSATRAAGTDLRELKEFKELRRLQIDNSQVNDATLRAIVDVDLLHIIPQAMVDGETRPRNAGEIRILDLSGSALTDAGLKELTDLKKLKELNLAKSRVTDAGVAKLQKSLPRCTISR